MSSERRTSVSKGAISLKADVQLPGPLHRSVRLIIESGSGERSWHPDAVRVELYANGVNGDALTQQVMTRGRQLSGGYVYRAPLPANRPATDYTARVIPQCSGVAVPMEAAHILWQR